MHSPIGQDSALRSQFNTVMAGAQDEKEDTHGQKEK